MLRAVLCWTLLFGLCAYAQCEPLDKTPRLKNLITTVAPENYEARITLKSGEVIVVERIALTEASLSRRFTINAIDRTMRVKPKGEDRRKTLNTDDIEKIEIVRVKDEPEVTPEKVPVSG